MKKINIVLAIVILFNFSCNKNKLNKEIIYSPHSEILEWTDYKDGSYWVYKDTLTNSIDSFYLYQRQDIYFPLGDETNDQDERIFHYYIYNTNDSIGDETFGDENSSLYIMHNLIGYGFYYVPNSNCPCKDVCCKGSYDSLIINNVKFNNVKCFKTGYVYSYWVKHIGVVRRIEINNTDYTNLHVWDLIRYNAIQ